MMKRKTDERFEQLVELPPSAKLVFFVIKRDGSVSQTELVERTLLSQQTTRSAIQSLKEIDLVQEDICIFDARKKIYSVRTSEVSHSD